MNRRKFLLKSSALGISGCLLASCPRIFASNADSFSDGEIPDPKKLNYCGYTCSSDCQFLKASLENNTELKKEAFRNWKIKEKYGLDFNPEAIFCFGCKVTDKPVGVVTANCLVRKCAIEKKLDCCIECPDLKTCDKELWKQFPDFKKTVEEMQVKYMVSKNQG